jgi:RNA polymerase sigma-70 factor (ECF subfamily)
MVMVGSQAEAQELAQETLVIAHDAFRTYRAEGSVRAFLFGIARRVCSRHVENRGRRDAKLRLVQDGETGGMDAAEAIALRERAMRARAALDQLRPTERDAVVLRFHGELSFRQVAEACGVDEPTARKRVSRALARLRASIEDS